MAEDIIIEQQLTKQEKYDWLLPQIEALIAGEDDVIANLANITAALKYGMNWLWAGVYFVKNKRSAAASEAGENEELVLGPFQGPVACSRIGYGKGVCGTTWKNKAPIIVEDVTQFPGHIACSSFSKSEIVLPAFKKGKVVMVLDIDSDAYSAFDKTDERNLLKIIALIENII